MLGRRTGQSGTVVQHSKTWDPAAPCYGKFWADVPGSPTRKRKTVALGVCKTKSSARQRLREYLDREGVNSKEAFHENTAPAITFRQQADSWIASLPARRRRPVKPATISGWRDALNAWVLPLLGDRPLSEVSNKAVRELVEKMSAAGLSPKTIVNYVQVAKLVVASAVSEEGEQIYPRTWNHDFIQLPVVQKEKQHRPTVTADEVMDILSKTKRRTYLVLFALLAATGLRIGEALGLRDSDFGPDCRVLHVTRSIWRGKEQEPKTVNAVRVIDLSEVLASGLRGYVSEVSGYLFATAGGNPLQQRNVLRVLHQVRPVGFHVFRRFRLAWLRKNSTPRDLEGYWMGHAAEEVGDLYSKLKDDVAFRQEWVERVGLGFQLVHIGPQNEARIETKKVA
jgi:integrase